MKKTVVTAISSVALASSLAFGQKLKEPVRSDALELALGKKVLLQLTANGRLILKNRVLAKDPDVAKLAQAYIEQTYQNEMKVYNEKLEALEASKKEKEAAKDAEKKAPAKSSK